MAWLSCIRLLISPCILVAAAPSPMFTHDGQYVLRLDFFALYIMYMADDGSIEVHTALQAAAAICIEAPVTPTPSPQQTPKQATTPLPTPSVSPITKGCAKPVDSPALDKLRSLLKDHADSRSKTPTPVAGAVGNKVCIDLELRLIPFSQHTAVTWLSTHACCHSWVVASAPGRLFCGCWLFCSLYWRSCTGDHANCLSLLLHSRTHTCLLHLAALNCPEVSSCCHCMYV